MTKSKQFFWHFYKIKKQKYLIYISIQTLCYETWYWAQVHPVSFDHPWDVSATWLGKLYSHPLLSTLLKHLWQRLQTWVFLGMALQAWPTCIWGVSPIVLFCFTAIFRSPEILDQGSSPGSGRATQGHSETCPEATPALSWLCAYGRCPVGKMYLHPSLRSWALWSRFSSRISLYLAPFIFPSILTSLPVPAAEKQPHSMMLPPPCCIVVMVSGFLQASHLAIRPKSASSVSSEQSILFLMVWESFRCLLANSKRAVMCLLLRSSFRLATLP